MAKGRREILGETHEVKITGEAAAADWNEIALRLNLRPGRYQMPDRGRAREHEDQRLCPRDRDRSLTSSTARSRCQGWRSGRPPVATSAAVRLSPTCSLSHRPSTVLSAATDRVGALLRVHQSRRRPALPVVLDTEIIDASGTLVRTELAHDHAGRVCGSRCRTPLRAAARTAHAWRLPAPFRCHRW